MDFNEAISTATPHWFAEGITDPITYNGSEIRGSLEYRNVSNITSNARDAKHAVLMISPDDVPNPQKGDVVVVDGTTWKVHQDERGDAVIEADACSITVILIRNERTRSFRR